MFNQTARSVFDERLKKIHAMPASDRDASEADLNYLAGLISYAFLDDQIGHEESTELHSQLNAARALRVSRLCQSIPRMSA